jgi:hypothetical protein
MQARFFDIGKSELVPIGPDGQDSIHFLTRQTESTSVDLGGVDIAVLKAQQLLANTPAQPQAAELLFVAYS